MLMELWVASGLPHSVWEQEAAPEVSFKPWFVTPA